MIKGIGIDLIENKRIKLLYKKYGLSFAKKILSVDELREFLVSKEPVNYLSKHFASKEALVKALGIGFRGLYPSDITLQKDDLGKPKLISSSLKDLDCHLSITNTDSYTLSFIVLEK